MDIVMGMSPRERDLLLYHLSKITIIKMVEGNDGVRIDLDALPISMLEKLLLICKAIVA